MENTHTSSRTTDYLIVGAGAMGIAFADELFTRDPQLKLTIVDRRAKPGGHWNNAYPFVKLHQPAAFYGVNSLPLGNGSSDLSSKAELLAYFEKVIDKFESSGRVEFLAEHNYLGNGQLTPLNNPDQVISYTIKKKLVDASYMNVEVPSTHAPKYQVDEGVPLVPINALAQEHNQWDRFYVIGNGKTGMDAVLFLLEKGVSEDAIHWICPNQAWLFNRSHIQVGLVVEEVFKHVTSLTKAKQVDDVFLELEKTGGIMRLDESTLPKKWRCATVNPEELAQLRRIKSLIQMGRVQRIGQEAIELQKGTLPYEGRTLFVDCTANGLAKRKQCPIFTEGKITLQSILFCQQVFSAATIARLEMTRISDQQKNQVTPVPHPELKEDWPSSLSVSMDNLLIAHRYFPMWMYRSRLNFLSHEPLLKYFRYATQSWILNPAVKKAVKRLEAQKQTLSPA